MTLGSIRWTGLSLAVLVASLTTTRASGGAGGEIRVHVAGLRNDGGQVGCMLFASADGFPRHPEKAVARQFVKIASRRASCVFGDIPPGPYAVVAMHDENANGKLDTNFFGIPTEGYGASRDARGTLGPPKFSDAVFAFPGGSLALTVPLRY